MYYVFTLLCNIVLAKGGAHLPIGRTPPAVHTGMMICGVMGGSSPHFFWAKSYFCCYSER